MYDREYQVIASHCRIINNNESPALRKYKAAIRENTIITKTKMVAIIRVGANIFLNWFMGPIKKQVLIIDIMFPMV